MERMGQTKHKCLAGDERLVMTDTQCLVLSLQIITVHIFIALLLHCTANNLSYLEHQRIKEKAPVASYNVHRFSFEESYKMFEVFSACHT